MLYIIYMLYVLYVLYGIHYMSGLSSVWGNAESVSPLLCLSFWSFVPPGEVTVWWNEVIGAEIERMEEQVNMRSKQLATIFTYIY